MPDFDELKTSDKKQLLIRFRECYKKAVDADDKNRKAAIANIRFARVPGSQWDEETKTDRGKDRLMLEFNQTKVQCKRVINEMRANRPQEKVRGYEDNDKDTAEVIEGLIRNIWNVSDGDSVADYQAEYQVYGGYGVFKIETDYSSDTAFDQDLKVANVTNPFCVWSDPAAKDMLKRDADWWIETEKIKKSAYKRRWPKAKQVDFEDDSLKDDEDWEEKDADGRVRIGSFWWKEPTTKTIALLTDGKSVDMEKDQPDEAMIAKGPDGKPRIREVKCHKVMMAVCSGDAVLEGPSEFVIDEFPFIPVYGDYMVIEGQIHWSGMVTDVKDSQRLFNSHMTNIAETVEGAAKEFDWVTTDQAKGNIGSWTEAHKKNFGWRIFNHDPQNPGPPIRAPGGQVPVALIQAAEMQRELMNSLAGFVFDPSGKDNQNSSGKALNARQRQGQIATFNYPDNMGKARKRLGELLIKAIPKVYDTERSIRILGADGAEKFVKVNAPDPVTGKVMNDLSRGKFDLTVTVGPSYATQRQEAVEAYTEMATRSPEIMTVAGDLIMKNMDLPGADQIAERIKFMLPPPIQKHIAEGAQQSPEVQQAMIQVEQASAMVDEKGKLVEAAAAEAQEEVNAATKAKADLQIAQANLKTEEANFKTMQADFKAQVAEVQLKLQKTISEISLRETNIDHESKDAEKVGKASNFAIEQLQGAAEAIKAEMGDFLASAAQVVVSNQNQPKPRVKGARAKRVNGELVAQVEYEDGSTKDMPVPRAETIQ